MELEKQNQVHHEIETNQEEERIDQIEVGDLKEGPILVSLEVTVQKVVLEEKDKNKFLRKSSIRIMKMGLTQFSPILFIYDRFFK